jgi:hypothetical protein
MKYVYKFKRKLQVPTDKNFVVLVDRVPYEYSIIDNMIILPKKVKGKEIEIIEYKDDSDLRVLYQTLAVENANIAKRVENEKLLEEIRSFEGLKCEIEKINKEYLSSSKLLEETKGEIEILNQEKEAFNNVLRVANREINKHINEIIDKKRNSIKELNEVIKKANEIYKDIHTISLEVKAEISTHASILEAERVERGKYRDKLESKFNGIIKQLKDFEYKAKKKIISTGDIEVGLLKEKGADIRAMLDRLAEPKQKIIIIDSSTGDKVPLSIIDGKLHIGD